MTSPITVSRFNNAVSITNQRGVQTITVTGARGLTGVVNPDAAQTLSNKTLASPLVTGLANYADDAAAAIGGVPVNGLYRTASALKIRVA